MLKLVWERWKKVPELEGVKVSSLGCVKINGKLIRPKVNDKGYFVVTYENNVHVGEATVTITATEEGNYSGTVTKTFEIKKAPITITAQPANSEYGTDISELQ